ncbi:Digalactosyldiacylglycerol synthase, family GT4 [Ectocarpus siliculosus]|uniref:Digalactosyldiacylglycerol synthase, family GT4 n=1 Tax=Ectocarpus siliculosus TaxID=2880 RepID=D8LGQ6_ECTSI|nr:Digalactosyldiacylglycerol synthase, family GT4 [Ectocarpus siliculosus]|eukprot:CBN79076.1 Digalactosyldiacylglycerol synthase, family GT4 [Ectocarpus siliculosus]
MDEDAASLSTPPDNQQQQQQQQQQREKAAFFRRSLPLPSIQSQRAVAERAVRRAKAAQRAVAERTVKRAKVALGTAFDDLGLTRPPVGSTLERFLHADEVLGLWRQEEALEDQMQDGDDVLPGTNIGIPERRIWVVTTAALPWMTGTSVNPLLRAAYLTRGRDPGKVSLMIPWLGLEDQHFVLPDGHRYERKEDQEAFIRGWLRGAGMTSEADDLRIAWYDARYHQVAGCIFPMGDITRLIPDDEADVCIMEEPEHLNWFRATGVNWSKKFTHVVGVIHTNYVHYTLADTNHWASGRVKAPFARAFNKIMARAYCDKVIKLSATLQKFAEEKETVTNVHGVRENFLLVGDDRAKAAARGEPFAAGNRPYFLGKMLWEKGYGKLWDLLEGYQAAQNQPDGEEGREASSPAALAEKKTAAAGDHRAHATPAGDKVDAGGDGGGIILGAYGSGPDSDPIRERAAVMGLSVEFNPATDHAELSQYKTFVNPSESEVLCTTVAEALAMGKFVVIAEHASNEFFYQFPNTLKFKSQEEFNEQLSYSMTNEPVPLTPEQRHVLGWSAATDRLVESAKVTVRESLRRRRELDEAAWLFHYYLGSGRRGDRVRKIMAGGVVAGQHAHMELVLKAEDEALELAEVAAGAKGGGHEAART